MTPQGIEEKQVPADLNQAPLSIARNVIPPVQNRPRDVPGVVSGLRDAPASIEELDYLNTLVMYWLSAASQQAADRPGSLTPEQLQRQVLLQARLLDIRTQLGTGLITDTHTQVGQEIAELKRENAGWQQPLPNMTSVYDFAKGVPKDSFLTPDLYREFKSLLESAIGQLVDYPQPDPLEKLRLQQLQVIRSELKMSDTRSKQIPQIRVSTAQLFLQQMLKYDQPLPSLYDLTTVGTGTLRVAAPNGQLETDSQDLIRDLRGIHWDLINQNEPQSNVTAQNALDLIQRLVSGSVPPSDMPRIRSEIAAYKNLRTLSGVTSQSELLPENFATFHPVLGDNQERATRLCSHVRAAFSCDADALGCPKTNDGITANNARTVINTVCDRLRTSAPTVTPEQFGCPPAPA